MRKVLFILLLSVSFCSYSQDSVEDAFNAIEDENDLEAFYNVAELAVNENHIRGLEYCLKVLRIAKFKNSDVYEGKTLYLMAKYSLNEGNYESALNYAQKSLAVIEKLEEINYLSDVNLLIGQIYFHLNNYDLALESYQKVLIYEYENDNHKNLSLVFQLIGDLSFEKGQFDKTLEAYENSLEEFEFVNNNSDEDKSFLSVSYRKMGNAYKNLNDFEKSLEFYIRALDYERSINNAYNQGVIHKEIGLLYASWGKQNMARLSLLTALEVMKDHDDIIQEGIIYVILGDIYYSIGDYNQALNYYNQGLNINRNEDDIEGIVNTLSKIANIYKLVSDNRKALNYLSEALNLTKEYEYPYLTAQIFTEMSEVYYKMNNYKLAFDYGKRSTEVKDSLYNEESGERIAQMQDLYEIARKENENKILRQKSEIQELEIDKNAYYRKYLLGIIFSITVVLILILLRYQSRKKIIDKQKENELRILELNRNLEKRVIMELKKQEKQQQLLAQKSKLESLGQLAAGIAHEINQPLGGISMGLDNVLYKIKKQSLNEKYLNDKIDLLFGHVERIKKIIEHVRIFSRTQKPILFEKVSLNEVVNNSLLMIQSQYEKAGISIQTNLQENIGFTIGDKFKMEQVLLNLLSNAKYAIDEQEKSADAGFRKTISIETRHNESTVFLIVTDNGIGMDTKVQKKIFDPFFTTKQAEKGTGLGLAITYGLIKDMLGEIRVESELNKFTSFEITLPRSYNTKLQ